MHGYASDNFFRGPKIYFAIGVMAIAVASLARALVSIPSLAGFVDTTALSAGAIYAGLIWLYDHWGWRWLSTLRNLNGTWVGEITSSHKGGARVPCVMRVPQTWTRMAIELESEQSRSRTTMAALYEGQPGDVGLKYEYVCEPRHRAVQTMQIHRGVCTMVVTTGGDRLRLSGDYFTGRGRETHGEITLDRISRSIVGFEAALEKEKK